MDAVVGRERELETITSFVAHGGRPSVLLLEGEAGIGKTTLWRAAVDEGRRRGFRILAASASPAETQLSFTAIRDLVDDAFDEIAGELPPPQRRALAITLLREEPAGAPPETSAIAIAFHTALRGLAERGPTLLAVDDVQWLDPASAAPLQHALHRLGPQGPLVLLSRRVEDEDEPPLGLARLDERRLQVVRIGALSTGAVARILRNRVGTTYSRPTVHRLHEVARGNPLFALELARALGRRGETRLVPGEPPFPSSLGELVREHLDALPGDTRESLVVVSAASRPTVDLVRSIVGEDGWRALARAFEANVVERTGERVDFMHPLLAAAVYSEAGPAHRRAVHAALAQTLDDGEERARHLALAADAPDETIAATLDEAARRTQTRGARVVCAELFEAAARLTPSADVLGRARRLLVAATAFYEAGDSDHALQLLEPLVTDLPEGRERVEARWRLGAVLTETGREDEGVRLWRDALAAAEDPALVADVRRSMAILSIYTGTTADAIEHASEAVAAAEASGDSARLAYALSARALAAVAGDSTYRDFVTRALEAESDVEAASSSWSPRAVAAECARLALELEEAVGAGNVEIEQWATYGLAVLDLLQGEHARAAARTEKVLELGEATLALRLPGRRLRAEIDAYVGRVDEARATFELLIEEAERLGHPRWGWQARVALASLALAEGEAAAAADGYRAAREIAERVGIRHRGTVSVLADEVEAAVLAGRPDQAEDALAAAARFQDLPDWAEALRLRAKAIVLASGRDLAAAEAGLEGSLSLHPPSLLPVERGRTLLALGIVQRRARKRNDARATLETARSELERVGAVLWAARAEAELGRLSGRAVDRDDLTPSERRIAELVAAGKTNREVAAALFVSVHTVEASLKRIYRKLDLRSRTELARRLPGKEPSKH